MQFELINLLLELDLLSFLQFLLLLALKGLKFCADLFFESLSPLALSLFLCDKGILETGLVL